MKSRDEFLQSVYAKEKTVKAQRKIYKKRMITSLATAAACLALVVGMGRIGLADLMMGGDGADGADMAVTEDGIDLYGDAQEESGSAPNDSNGSSNSNSDGFLQADSLEPGYANVTGNYCMPVAVEVEGADGKGIRYEEVSDMDQAIKWIRELVRDGKACEEKDLSAKRKQNYVYKVTLVYSSEDDPDSAGSDQIYYILEETSLFE